MEVLTILAIVFSPLIAVQVTQWLNKNKEADKRRIDVFRKLMASRATTISPEHVTALNRIDIEFYDKKKKFNKVLDTWKIYHDHLSAYSLKLDENENALKIWSDKNPELLTDLLYEMSQSLGYDFDKVTIKRGHYFPRGLDDLQTDHYFLRKGLVDIVSGKNPLRVLALNVPHPGVKQNEELEQESLNSR